MRMNANLPKQIVEDELNRLKERIIENHIAAGQVASGKTMRSIHEEIKDDSGILYGRMFFDVLETGRKGGKVPYKFVTIIMKWMEDKGIRANPIPYVRKPSERWQPKYSAEERGQRSLAGAIAYRIKKSGTSLFRKGGRDDIYSKEIPLTVKNIGERILKVMEIEVESIHINYIKK